MRNARINACQCALMTRNARMRVCAVMRDIDTRVCVIAREMRVTRGNVRVLLRARVR
jgi:hypothetical protein